MPCSVCGKADEETKYKCPKCSAKYCSVACYKVHQKTCPGSLPSPEPDAEPPQQTLSSSEGDKKFQPILENDRIQELLSYESVQKHLALIARILKDPRISGEQSREGRQIVALKKIRELRKGGREANAAIEELATVVTELSTDEQI